jgi:hypothetical protein
MRSNKVLYEASMFNNGVLLTQVLIDVMDCYSRSGSDFSRFKPEYIKLKRSLAGKPPIDRDILVLQFVHENISKEVKGGRPCLGVWGGSVIPCFFGGMVTYTEAEAAEVVTVKVKSAECFESKEGKPSAKKDVRPLESDEITIFDHFWSLIQGSKVLQKIISISGAAAVQQVRQRFCKKNFFLENLGELIGYFQSIKESLVAMISTSRAYISSAVIGAANSWDPNAELPLLDIHALKANPKFHNDLVARSDSVKFFVKGHGESSFKVGNVEDGLSLLVPAVETDSVKIRDPITKELETILSAILVQRESKHDFDIRAFYYEFYGKLMDDNATGLRSMASDQGDINVVIFSSNKVVINGSEKFYAFSRLVEGRQVGIIASAAELPVCHYTYSLKLEFNPETRRIETQYKITIKDYSQGALVLKTLKSHGLDISLEEEVADVAAASLKAAAVVGVMRGVFDLFKSAGPGSNGENQSGRTLVV